MKKWSEFITLRERCWPGYKPKPGKKAYSDGSCIKEDLRRWFSKTDPEGGWKRINSKGEAIGPCAREPGEPKPKCMSNEKRAQLTKKERASAVRAKRKHDPNPERQGKPINVSNFGKGKISEDMEHLDEKNVPTSPEKWAQAKAQAKSKFDVYPSAYANGWAAKKYKEMGGGWKSVSEAKDEEEYGYEGDMAMNQLETVIRHATYLKEMMKPDTDLPEWVQSKITLATDYLQTACDYMTSELKEELTPTSKPEPGREAIGGRFQSASPKKPMKPAPQVTSEATKEDPPFDPDPPKKHPVAKAGKYGQGYSTARHLARMAMDKVSAKYKKPLKEDEEMSNKARIVKDVAKSKKKKDSADEKNDTFQAEPILSKSQTKNY